MALTQEQINQMLKNRSNQDSTGIELENTPTETYKPKMSFKELTWKEVSWTKNVAKTSDRLKDVLDLGKKIPWLKKILPVAKVAGKYAWPIGIALAVWDWLMDVRWEELSNDDKSRATRLANLVNDITWKTIINTVWSTAEWLPTALAWVWWQALDTFNEMFWDKEARETDYSTKAVEAWNDSKIKNWLWNTRAKMLWFQDKMIYWKDTTNEYKNELWLNKDWTKKQELDIVPEEQQIFETENKQEVQQPKIEQKKESPLQEQWRRIVQFKDWTYWYASQWWDTKWKLVTWVDSEWNRVIWSWWWFKTLDEAKQAIQSWVKWYHEDQIVKWIKWSESKEAAKKFLNKYESNINLKDKWFSDKEISDINTLFM